MRRDPSIHIKESDLVLVLEKLLEGDKLLNFNSKQLAMDISTESKRYSLVNRSMVITNERMERKANTILKSDKSDAYLMSKIIHASRVKAKHRGVRLINQNAREWGIIKEITAQALDFSNSFQLSKKEGFTIYITKALSKMQKFSLNKIPNMYEGIASSYEADLILKDDDKPNATKSIHDYYVQKIYQKTGMGESYLDNREKYLYFYKTRMIAEEIGVTYKDYLEAQFAGFSYRDGIPDPVQLVGDAAKKRLSKYLYENNLKVNPERKKKDNSNFWDTLKSMSNE